MILYELLTTGSSADPPRGRIRTAAARRGAPSDPRGRAADAQAAGSAHPTRHLPSLCRQPAHGAVAAEPVRAGKTSELDRDEGVDQGPRPAVRGLARSGWPTTSSGSTSHARPVSAGPPTAGYRVRKFVRRNRGRVIAASLVLLALFAGIVGTALGLVEANLRRVEAETRLRQKNKANEIPARDLRSTCLDPKDDAEKHLERMPREPRAPLSERLGSHLAEGGGRAAGEATDGPVGVARMRVRTRSGPSSAWATQSRRRPFWTRGAGHAHRASSAPTTPTQSGPRSTSPSPLLPGSGRLPAEPCRSSRQAAQAARRAEARTRASRHDRIEGAPGGVPGTRCRPARPARSPSSERRCGALRRRSAPTAIGRPWR